MAEEEQKYWMSKEPFAKGVAAPQSNAGVPPGQPTPAPGQPVGPPVTSAEKKTKALREKEHAESARLNSSKSAWSSMVTAQGGTNDI